LKNILKKALILLLEIAHHRVFNKIPGQFSFQVAARALLFQKPY